MRRVLNTLYVTTENAWLRKSGANIVVEADGEERGRAPLHMPEGVIGFGRAGAPPGAAGTCAEAGITVSLLSPEGRFLARVEGVQTGNVLLRRAQFHASEDVTVALSRGADRNAAGSVPIFAASHRPLIGGADRNRIAARHRMRWTGRPLTGVRIEPVAARRASRSHVAPHPDLAGEEVPLPQRQFPTRFSRAMENQGT